MNGLSYLTVLTYVGFRFRGGTKASGEGGGDSFVLGLLNPLCFIKGQFSVREIFAGQNLNN